MDITPVTEITTHADDAVARFPQQYKDKTKLENLTRQLAERMQSIESVFFDLFDKRSIYVAEGSQLDGIGQIVDQPRNGSTDDVYRIRIFAKIAQNVSRGTAEDLINIYKLLMQADRVYFYEIFPAAISMTVIGAAPISDTNEIKKAINASKSAGVAVESLVVAEENAFSFLEDPDPNGRGFGVLSDPDEGGVFAFIL